MSDSDQEGTFLKVENPATRDERRSFGRVVLASNAGVAALVVTLMALTLGVDHGWFLPAVVVVLATISTVTLALFMECTPGVVRLAAPPGDRIVDAVARARAAADSAQRAALTLTGPAGDQASIGAHTLPTAVWQLAEFANQAPSSGPGRDAVASELEQRALAIENVATALERASWEDGATLGFSTADALIAEAGAATERLQRGP